MLKRSNNIEIIRVQLLPRLEKESLWTSSKLSRKEEA